MKKVKLFTIVIVLITNFNLSAQLAITADGSSPDASAMLDVKSVEKGMLVPRMTQSQIQSIAYPADGLLVFNTDDNHHYFYDAGAGEWKEIAMGTGTITPTPSWTCGDALVDSRDGQSYNTVLIGTQCWMAENLNIGTRIDGVNDQTDNSIIEKYCDDNNTTKCDTYGGLYQWDEMMQYIVSEGVQGICPEGWYLPTDDDWKQMEMVLGMSQSQADAIGSRGTNEGSKMKNTSGWLYSGNGTNSSGFSGLPGGHRLTSGAFNDIGGTGYWWSSTEYADSNPWKRSLEASHDQVYRFWNYKGSGFSVRCLKN